MNEKSEGRKPGARGDLVPKTEAPAAVILAGVGGGGGLGRLGLQLPPEIAGGSGLQSRSFLYQTGLFGFWTGESYYRPQRHLGSNNNVKTTARISLS